MYTVSGLVMKAITLNCLVLKVSQSAPKKVITKKYWNSFGKQKIYIY